MIVTLNADRTILRATKKQSTKERTAIAQSDWDMFPFRLICGNPADLLEQGFFLEGFFNAGDVLNALRGYTYIDCRDAEAQRLLDDENKCRWRRRAELEDAIVRLTERLAKSQRFGSRTSSELRKARLEHERIVCLPYR
jgi:hypothetical protein